MAENALQTCSFVPHSVTRLGGGERERERERGRESQDDILFMHMYNYRSDEVPLDILIFAPLFSLKAFIVIPA